MQLSEIYSGVNDEWLNLKHKARTFETTFVTTRKDVVRYEVIQEEQIPHKIQKEYDELREKFLSNPETYLEEYYSIKQIYNEYATAEKKPVTNTMYVQIAEENTDPSHYGYTNLRFSGNPNQIKTIALCIGGAEIDRIYPSITETFEPISIFNSVLPRTLYHTMSLKVVFEETIEKEAYLFLEWDVVSIKNTLASYEIPTCLTSYYGKEKVYSGLSKVMLSFCLPVETLKIYTENSVEKMTLLLDTHKMHISYKGKQGNKHLYEYHFIHPVNFARVKSTFLEIKSTTENTVYPMAICWNGVRFSHGMGSLLYST